MNKLPELPPVETANPMSINPKVLKIIGGQDKWDQLCILYKEKQLQSKGRTPQLVPLFKEMGLSERQYNQVVGLIGDKDELHKALTANTKLALSVVMALFNETAEALRKHIGTANVKELVEIMKIMPSLMGNPQPTTQIQVNNNTGWSIDKHLADRGIVIEETPDEG